MGGIEFATPGRGAIRLRHRPGIRGFPPGWGAVLHDACWGVTCLVPRRLNQPNPLGRLAVAIWAVALLGGAASALGAVVGDIVRIGYLGSRNPVVRAGAWTPVVVDLGLDGQTSFDGLLRLRQFDRDGDVYVDTVPVHLVDAGDGGRQRYWLYTVANPQSTRRDNFEVELLETESGLEDDATRVQVISGGVPVPALRPEQNTELITDDVHLILEISTGQLGRIRHLADRELHDRFDRPVEVAHVSPLDLPNSWLGLEMVDYILWEDADPTLITPAQERALVEWVEHGGRLALAAGRTADALAQSDRLGGLLPVRVGRVASTRSLPEVRSRMLSLGGGEAATYPQGIVYVRTELVDDPDVKSVLDEPELDTTVVSTRRVGRGTLTFVAASTGDLLAVKDADLIKFHRSLFELRSNPANQDNLSTTLVNLMTYLDREVAFYQAGAARLAVALLFAVGYVLLATFGAWRLLQKRDWLRQSWTALAVTAIAASVVSLIGVQVIHGVGRDLRQLTIVDGVANQVAARATAYYGLKTATHSRLDLWLPSDSVMQTEPEASACALKPMLEPRTTVNATAGFTDPGRYQLMPSTAEILNVPVRATLKQFEGRWQGDLRGTVLSSVAAAPVYLPKNDAELSEEVYGFSEDSWIENGLETDLHDCQLYFVERDLVSPQNLLMLDQRGGSFIYPLYVFGLGRIESGERVNLYERIFQTSEGEMIPLDAFKRQTLDGIQLSWGRSFIPRGETFGGVDEKLPDYRFDHYQNVILLATVLGDVSPTKFGISSFQGLRVFSRGRLRHLDVGHLLTSHSALLVGFADDAGPARLCVRPHGRTEYKPVEPEEPRTVYRFVIPVEVPR
jgi:hypothetical protein